MAVFFQLGDFIISGLAKLGNPSIAAGIIIDTRVVGATQTIRARGAPPSKILKNSDDIGTSVFYAVPVMNFSASFLRQRGHVRFLRSFNEEEIK